MTPSPRAHRIARWVYTVALRMWPVERRERDGDEMCATFDALCRDAGAHGILSVLRLLTREIVDLARTSRAARRVLASRRLSSLAPGPLSRRLSVWPGQNPIGQQLHLGVRLVRGVRSGQKTIVGIVGDVKYLGLDAATPAEVYLPHAQHPVEDLAVAVRTTRDPLSFLPQARAALAAMDRELPMADVRTMTDIVGRSVAERRFVMLLLVAFASVAVLLAAIGVYGVLAYVVSQRTQEIGVRLAIGAAPADVVRLFVREGAALTVIGLACGLAGAAAAGRALTSLLFGITATDPATFAAVAAALVLVALGASYVPARRAARVDPMTALRTD